MTSMKFYRHKKRLCWSKSILQGACPYLPLTTVLSILQGACPYLPLTTVLRHVVVPRPLPPPQLLRKVVEKQAMYRRNATS